MAHSADFAAGVVRGSVKSSPASLSVQLQWQPAPAAVAPPLVPLSSTAQPVYVAPPSQPGNPMSLDPIAVPVPSTVQSRNSGGTAAILPAERERATFDCEKLMNFMDGGPEMTKRRRFIVGATQKADLSDKYNWDRHQILKEHVRHFISGTHEPYMENFIPTREDISWMSEYSMNSGALGLHFGVFVAGLLGNASDEQQGWWLSRALQFQIIGCYAQTELGHGSNVRALRTTAVFDKATQQFVLNTPTLQSLKWWPSGLGKLSTHALLYAQLVIDGKEHGVHVFMLQVRDEDHRPLPGIELGDLGPKIGDAANDTAWMRLTDVRIPREHMLARWQEVTPEGKYVKNSKGTGKEHYSTMLQTRGGMLRIASGMLARAVTIATRYSCVRAQGFKDTSTTSYQAPENALIEYQVQQYRIARQLAFTYAIKFTARWMIGRFADVGVGSGSGADAAALGEVAATAAGLKALITLLTADGIEDLRKCCGGNGYLLSSGIAQLQADYVFQPTAEGDFVILMLQTARHLMKMVRSAQKGEELASTISYLKPLGERGWSYSQAVPPSVTSVANLLNTDLLQQLFRYRALVLVSVAADTLDGHVRRGLSQDEAWSSSTIELLAAVRAHCHNFILSTFVGALATAEDAAVRASLRKLCLLYALSNVLDDATWTGLLSAVTLKFARNAVRELLGQLRGDLVALTDAFDIPDRVLNSTIGGRDGNIYEALFEAAKKSQLNLRDPFDGYYEYLQPKLDREFLKHGNAKDLLAAKL
eukprot:TRINITY_DN3684_c0_g1_i1.p1 TRINITY_DN3684_c0_g1~~TRINITY_DN3684_c0_g1_i1.p1  ORF type:complete len:761 (+),score=159.03 TRINITY_DN3684_c0_g1_i1:10-2292(+)